MHSTRIELFYFDDKFRRIAQCVLAFMLKETHTPGVEGPNYHKIGTVWFNIYHAVNKVVKLNVTFN